MSVLVSETVLMGSMLPVDVSEVMGRVDVPNSEVSAGLVLEVKLESELTLGVVVETVDWGVVETVDLGVESGDGVDMVVLGLDESGLEVSEDWDVCGTVAVVDAVDAAEVDPDVDVVDSPGFYTDSCRKVRTLL